MDEQIRKEIIKRFYSDNRICLSAPSSKMDVTAKDQSVTLSGELPSWGAYRAAVEAAISCPGVKSIRDDLKCAFGA